MNRARYKGRARSWHKASAWALIAMLAIMALSACGGGGGDGDGGEGEGDPGGTPAGEGANPPVTLNIAYQYGIQYLPVKVLVDQGLIAKYYDGDVTVNTQTLGSGAEINEAIIAGNVGLGFMGPSVAITGVTKGVPYKVFAGVSNIPSRMVVSDANIKTLKDFKAQDKIALVGTGSIQHIILAYAAAKELGDAHALDTQIMGMPHPDGMQALISGSVKGHLTTIPYSLNELSMPEMHEVEDVFGNFVPNASIIVGVMSTKLAEENRALADAVIQAFEEAVAYCSDEANRDAIAEDIYDEEGVTKEKMLEFLSSPDVKYDTTVSGLMTIAEFMTKESFLDEAAPTEAAAFFFDGVNHEG